MHRIILFLLCTLPGSGVGVTVSTFMTNAAGKRIGFHYSYDQVLPQDVNIFDTLTARINGFKPF